MIDLDNVNPTSDNPFLTRGLDRRCEAEKILPSIEHPFRDIGNPFKDRGTENNRHAFLNSIHYAEHDGQGLSAAREPTNSKSNAEYKQQLGSDQALSSPYNRNQAAARTMLIPLEEYEQRNRDAFQVQDTGLPYSYIRGSPQARADHGHETAKHLIGHISPGTITYPNRAWSPQSSTQGPGRKHQHKPHLQIQLTPRASAPSGASSFSVSSPQHTSHIQSAAHLNDVQSDSPLAGNRFAFVENERGPNVDTGTSIPCTRRPFGSVPKQYMLQSASDNPNSSKSANNTRSPRDTDAQKPWQEIPAMQEPKQAQLQRITEFRGTVDEPQGYRYPVQRIIADQKQAPSEVHHPPITHDWNPLPSRPRPPYQDW